MMTRYQQNQYKEKLTLKWWRKQLKSWKNWFRKAKLMKIQIQIIKNDKYNYNSIIQLSK